MENVESATQMASLEMEERASHNGMENVVNIVESASHVAWMEMEERALNNGMTDAVTASHAAGLEMTLHNGMKSWQAWLVTEE